MLINKKILAVLGIVVALAFFAGNSFLAKNRQGGNVASVQGATARVYKSPTCGCCVGFTGFLKKDGYSVNIEETADMQSVKQTYNIPSSMQSCHTSIIGDYFVEGHIPLEIIDKLLAEKPDLDGIALPGMPSGSPGMPGLKTEEFIIYGLKGGEISEFARI